MKHYSDFRFHLYTDMLFGKGTEKEAGRMIRKHGGSKVMLVYGGGSIKKSGLYDRVVSSLKEEGLPFIELSGVRANPRRSLVEANVKTVLDGKVDFFLAVGGGSVIDTAKALALAAANGGRYWEFWHGAEPPRMAPVGTINTIAAAGSESSRSTVLVDDLDTGLKRGLMWACCRPVFAIMNPELTFTVPPFQTAAGAADIFAHTFMRYFWLEDLPGYLGDELSEGLLRTVVKYGPIAVTRPEDYEARAELMLAACFSHNDLTQLGRTGAYGGEHALEHQLSGHYDTPHGAGLSVIMPALLRYIIEYGPPKKVARVAQFLVKVFHAPLDMSSPKETALGGLPLFRSWLRSMGMPLTLEELGVPGSDAPQITERCVKATGGAIKGFMTFDAEAIAKIYSLMAGPQ